MAETFGTFLRASLKRRGMTLRAYALAIGLGKLSFDEERLALLRAWPDAVAAMTRAQKTEALAGFPFEKAAARKALGM
jgi:hypothetical protein